MAPTTRASVLALVLVASTGLAGCGTEPASSDQVAGRDERGPSDGHEPGHALPGGGVHWTYGDGSAGPAHWSELSDDFASCAEGSHQSPVDLALGGLASGIAPTDAGSEATEAPDTPPGGTAHEGTTPERTVDEGTAAADNVPQDVIVQVDDVDGVVADTGHTFQLTVEPRAADMSGMRIAYAGTDYALAQMHYHVPSEHTVDGAPADAEVHFVLRSDDDGVLVLALLADKGPPTAAVRPFIDAVRAGRATATALDLSKILPRKSLAFFYEGSFTTPPCTEGVHWIVLADRITLAPKQLDAFTDATHHNARPVQPLGDTVVTHGTLRHSKD